MIQYTLKDSAKRPRRLLAAPLLVVALGLAAPAAADEAPAPTGEPGAAPLELVAQGITGRCSGIDPADFNTVSDFVDSIVAASGGFATPQAEQNSIDCAETLQLAGEYRDIANPPVTVAIRRLVADCEASNATLRTCSALRSVLHKAIIANSEPFPPLDKEPFFFPPRF